MILARFYKFYRLKYRNDYFKKNNENSFLSKYKNSYAKIILNINKNLTPSPLALNQHQNQDLRL